MKRHARAIAVVMAVCMSICGSIPRDAAAAILASPDPEHPGTRLAAPGGAWTVADDTGTGRAADASRWSRAIVLLVILVIIILLIYRSFRGWKPAFA